MKRSSGWGWTSTSCSTVAISVDLLGSEAPAPDRLHQSRVIALGLVRVGLGEPGHGVVQHLALAHVPGHLGEGTRAAVGAGQRLAAEIAVGGERFRVHAVEDR